MSQDRNRGIKAGEPDRSPTLFPLPPIASEEPKIARLKYPVWTENKARFIARYLYYFVLVTKHGSYIDGFAGPQRPANPEMWAAKLVLESEPKRLRHFYLFDKSERQIHQLRQLEKIQPKVKGRTIQIIYGDFNVEARRILQRGEISQKEATFCLLDQRTFQCQWGTVAELASYKKPGNPKIELFYFLAGRWLRRALSAVRNPKLLELWWGRTDWKTLRAMTPKSVMDEIVGRFKCELGYQSAKPYPIYEREGSKAIVYYMIHATDHPAAPALMTRAYNRVVQPRETPEQFKLFLDSVISGES